MAVTTRLRNKITDGINTLFASIGTTKETKVPKLSKSNVAMIAWEYYVAKRLDTMASARRKEATKQAVEAGVIFDHEKHPREAGTTDKVYEDENILILVSVSSPSTSYNAQKLIAFLEASLDAQGLELLEEAKRLAVTVRRPAHEFKPIVKTTDTEPNGK